MKDSIHIAWFMSESCSLVAYPFNMLAAEYFFARGYDSLLDVADELWNELYTLCYNPLTKLSIAGVGKFIPYALIEEMESEMPIYSRKEDLNYHALTKA